MTTKENKKQIIIVLSIIILTLVFLAIIFLPLTNLSGTNEIAVIKINGEISYDSNNSGITPNKIEAEIKDAENNPNVKAILFEINSDGGSLVASEEITKMIKNCKKPKVSWISDNGTSQAYLVATGSETIVASHSSSVGGIGISFINNTKYSKTAQRETISTNLTKSTNVQKMINQDYEQFIKEIGANRNLSKTYLIKIDQGKVNGNKALELKLINKIGDKEEAIKIAASKANISNYTVVEYPKEEYFKLTDILNDNQGFNFQMPDINLNSNINSQIDSIIQNINQEFQKINNAIYKTINN